MPNKITVYMNGTDSTTTLDDNAAEMVQAAALEAWNGGGSRLLVVNASEANEPAVYINLSRVNMIEIRDVPDD